jgi:5'-3' exonuclease
MGIPAYFSYIIKNHAHILKNLVFVQANVSFANLYMDCNSIIYDVYRELLTLNFNHPDPTFDDIIDKTITAIRTLVGLIRPSDVVYIAFDGVAPAAKMKQQRQRRYKTYYMSESGTQSTVSTTPKQFNTTMITPGTRFMQHLSTRLREEFVSPTTGPTYIVSSSDEPGEGEHKMVHHMRENPNPSQHTAIYGLDSDLIMLAINHRYLFKNVYIFREAQEFFISRIPIKFTHPKEPYFMDIHALMGSIGYSITGSHPSDPTTRTPMQVVYDYVFMCFFIGNDFLPHFPMVNIRTHGIQVLLDTYNQLPTKHRKLVNMAEGGQQTGINWSGVHRFVELLAKNEHELFTQEYSHRDKQSRRFYPETTPNEKEEALMNAPGQFRGEEMYISPHIPGWESRYYKALFHTKNPTHTFIREICINYLEGLEWVFDYYTRGCTDWGWKYKYDYGPLFRDLYKYTPNIGTQFIHQHRGPVSMNEQLMYVLPRPQLVAEGIVESSGASDIPDIRYQWAFCKYLWEAHLTIGSTPTPAS